MTQTVWEDNDAIESSSGGNGRKSLIPALVGVVGILAIVITSMWGINVPTVIQNVELETYNNLTVSQIKIIEMSSGHKLQQTGEEVLAALACLGANGSTKTFKTYGFQDENGKFVETNVWLCMTTNGDWYGIVTTLFKKIGENQVARLIAGYKVSTSLFPTIEDYIGYLTSRWGATATNFTLAAEKIFIKPLK